MSSAAVTQADLLNALNTLRAEMAQLNMRREGAAEAIAEVIIPPVNGADTAFILICTVLVLMMTLPGLALFYGGLSQATNVLGTVMQSFAVTCLVTFLWLCFGYTIAFGPGESANDYIGGNERLWLNGINTPVPKFTLPESLFCIFQLTFAIITAAIITGSTAERMRFGPLLVFLGMWHIFVYCPLAHFEWGGGFMSKWGVLDFAGGDVVHISSGVSGLAASLIVGKRKAYSQGQAMPPHNVLLVFMGGSLLWVGWFGFNGPGLGGRLRPVRSHGDARHPHLRLHGWSLLDPHRVDPPWKALGDRRRLWRHRWSRRRHPGLWFHRPVWRLRLRYHRRPCLLPGHQGQENVWL